jgi:ribonuclease P protein component
MLNRSSRLTTKQFNEVMKNGKVVHSAFFMARMSSPAESTRISAVTPVKIAKKAVLRNKMRRRTYAAVRPLLAGISFTAHIILIAKAPLLLIEESAAIQADLRDLFVKARLIR